MLAIYERFVQAIRDARTDDDIREIVGDLAAHLGYRSGFLIEYGPNLQSARMVIDTDLSRDGWWKEYFGEGLRDMDQRVWERLLQERVVYLNAENVTGRSESIDDFARRNDLVDLVLVPISNAGELNAAVVFSGNVELQPRQEGGLLLTAYALYAQVRLIHGIDSIGRRAQLTPREREVVSLSAEGLTSQQIAERLGMSARTANQHIDNVMDKLGTRNRTHTIAEAIRQNLMH